jgi:hypothetical protein
MKKYLVIASFPHWDGYIHVFDEIESSLNPKSDEFTRQLAGVIYDATLGDDFFEDKDWEEGSDPRIVSFYEIKGGEKKPNDNFGEYFLNIANHSVEEILREQKERQEREHEEYEKEEYERLKEKFEGQE